MHEQDICEYISNNCLICLVHALKVTHTDINIVCIGANRCRPNAKIKKNRMFPHTYIFLLQIGTNMADYLTRHQRVEHPYVLKLGDCTQAYLIINGRALEHGTLLSAVSECFKAFYVFDIAYPSPCAQVWEFLQTVFEIPGPVRPTIQVLRAQFSGDGACQSH